MSLHSLRLKSGIGCDMSNFLELPRVNHPQSAGDNQSRSIMEVVCQDIEFFLSFQKLLTERV